MGCTTWRNHGRIIDGGRAQLTAAYLRYLLDVKQLRGSKLQLIGVNFGDACCAPRGLWYTLSFTRSA
jgi:hypothetical protein